MNLGKLSTLFVISALTAACTVNTGTNGSDAGSSGSSSSSSGSSSSSSSSGSSGASDAGTAVGCDFGEPNDVREQATAIDLDHAYTGLCVSSTDDTDEKDFFVITAPSDAAGGYVQVDMTNVSPDGLAEFIVTAVGDNGVMVDKYTTDNGASIRGWFAVAPGAKYRVQVNRFGGAGTRFTYDLKLSYTKINDTFEPNDTKDAAVPMDLNKPIQASAATVSVNADPAKTDDADWYKVTLAAGTATIVLSNSPADYLCDVQLFDDAGQAAGEFYTTTPGANCQIDAKDLKGGTYFIDVHGFTGAFRTGGENDAPPQVTQQYTLEAKQ